MPADFSESLRLNRSILLPLLLLALGCGGGREEPAPTRLEVTYFPKSQKVQARRTMLRLPAGEEVVDGVAEEFYSSGQIAVRGEFARGLRAGQWTAWHANGRKWVEGAFAAGSPRGEWVYFDEDGQECGRRINGQKQGTWRERNAQLDALGSGAYLDNVMHGLWKFVSLDGRPLAEVEYARGIPQGKALLRFGQTELAYQLEQGKEEPGLRRLRYADKEYRGDDPRFGKVIKEAKSPLFEVPFWIPLEGPFDPPRIHTRRALHPNGRLASEMQFQVCLFDERPMWILHGAWREWDPDGRKKLQRQYQGGAEEGEFLAWHPNGQASYRVEFHRGQPHGQWTFWGEQGELAASIRLDDQGRIAAADFYNAEGRPVVVRDVDTWLKRRGADR